MIKLYVCSISPSFWLFTVDIIKRIYRYTFAAIHIIYTYVYHGEWVLYDLYLYIMHVGLCVYFHSLTRKGNKQKALDHQLWWETSSTRDKIHLRIVYPRNRNQRLAARCLM